MKPEKTPDDKNLLRGVSTLDFVTENLKQPILLLIFTLIFSGFIYAGHSILDLVDPGFNTQLRTNAFGTKGVSVIKVLPDNKILASGNFNNYNGQPVGSLIRLNANGALDASFNNNVIASGRASVIVLQPDGKIIIASPVGFTLNAPAQTVKNIARLNADGTIDSTFNYRVAADEAAQIQTVAIDSNGRILVGGTLRFAQNGVFVSKGVIRLNADGTLDNSFNSTVNTVPRIAVQNNKPIVALINGAQGVYRLNEDGSIDGSFTPNVNNFPLYRNLIVLPDNKILALDVRKLIRLNENGTVDSGFQQVNFASQAIGMVLSGNGKITVAEGNSSITQFTRLLPNGTPDPTFTPFAYTSFLGGFDVQSDGSVVIGDDNSGTAPLGNNAFIRLLPNGSVDTAFNSGGTGFQIINPGAVRAIAVQPDGKIIIGGNFDTVNDVSRPKIARLNADSTIDNSFQISVNGVGNTFSQIREVYNITVQQDGKLLVTGSFNYYLNGVEKQNMVRLNADGSIDPTFNLSAIIVDTFRGSANRFVILNDGKIVVSTPRTDSRVESAVAIRLNSNGVLDNTFTPTAYNNRPVVYIMDIAVQPDGKILIGGRYEIPDPNSNGVLRSFIARLNSDGSTDPTFQVSEENDREISAFKLLQDGKILIARLESPFAASQRSNIFRLNANGSADNSFNAGTGANGRINALLILPSGKIMVGGNFTIFNGQPRGNLAQINADGSLDPMTFSVNQEVLSLTLDGQGRVLVGGSFTTINVNAGQNFERSFVARLIDSSAQAAGRTRFDFDGDGKADLAVFTASNGNWSIRNSQASQISNAQFGQSGDKTVTADFDNDGKTDLAVYRPAQGTWYLSRSTAGLTAVQWGAAEDKPVPADFDGDGKADIAVWRPSTGVWYILRSGASSVSYQFGKIGDVPVPADFDGDGKTDVAVFRPSDRTFYWLASGSNNQLKGVQFGQADDIPAVADYNGDGKSDLAVFRPSDGFWYQYLTTTDGSYRFSAVPFGQAGDEPVAADYDGDGKADIAVRRQGVWHMLKSGQGYSDIAFGSTTAQAVAALPN